MVQSGKECSCHYSKTSHEISGDPDGVSNRLNLHGKEKVSDKRSKLVANAEAKNKLEETTGNKNRGKGENKKNIGQLMAVLLIKVELLKLKKKEGGGNPLQLI